MAVDGRRGSAPSRAVSISPHVVGVGETGSVTDAVVAWTRGSCRAGSLVLTIAHSGVVGALMSFVDGICADVFGEVHPVSILNFGLYQYVISLEMFGID